MNPRRREHGQEGWEAHDIVALILVVSIASLVYLICWPAPGSDVSAAAGVGGYMVGTLSLLITMVMFGVGHNP